MKKVLFFAAIAAAALSWTTITFANSKSGIKKKEYEATNCTFTGNSSDHCNASNGTVNVVVLQCAPGETDCFYQL